MKKYEVISHSAVFDSGIIELVDGQSMPRFHKLQHKGNNLFEIVSPVLFRKGEIVGFDGVISNELKKNIKEVELANGALEKTAKG